MPRLTDHLRLHRGKWQVRVTIPVAARGALGGKTCLIRSLDTTDRKTASVLKGVIITDFKARIAEALDPNATSMVQARAILRQIDASQGDERQEIEAHTLAVIKSYEVEAQHGEKAGQDFYALAVGFHSPLDHYVDQWLAERGFIGKTVMQHRKAFAVLAEWCTSQRIEPNLKAITRRVARDFIAKRLRLRIKATKTINRYLSTYRTHWAWLIKDDRVTENPWASTHIPDNRSRSHEDDDAGKRSFTDAEAQALLSGPAPQPLADLMMVAALTGARIDALSNLRVRDCEDRVFNVRKAKREKRARPVPIHTRLAAIVERRIAGKRPDDFLFHELPAATDLRPRSAAASQAFTHYRRRLGIEEKQEGQRQSNVDFHSWRRWFTTKAEQAGQHPHIIDAVTGHARPGETLGRYSEGPSIDQLRACVEAVKLPSLPAKPPKAPVSHATRPPSPPRKKRLLKRRTKL